MKILAGLIALLPFTGTGLGAPGPAPRLQFTMNTPTLCHFYWQAEAGHTYELKMGHTPRAASMTNILYRWASDSHQHGEFGYEFRGENQFFRLLDTITPPPPAAFLNQKYITSPTAPIGPEDTGPRFPHATRASGTPRRDRQRIGETVSIHIADAENKEQFGSPIRWADGERSTPINSYSILTILLCSLVRGRGL